MVSIIQTKIVRQFKFHGAPAWSLRSTPLHAAKVGATHQEQKKIDTNAAIDILKSTKCIFRFYLLVCESVEGLSFRLHQPISLAAVRAHADRGADRMGPISVDFWRVSQRKDIPTSLFTSGENICWRPYAIKARNGSYHGDCQSEKILSKRGKKPSVVPGP